MSTGRSSRGFGRAKAEYFFAFLTVNFASNLAPERFKYAEKSSSLLQLQTLHRWSCMLLICIRLLIFWITCLYKFNCIGPLIVRQATITLLLTVDNAKRNFVIMNAIPRVLRRNTTQNCYIRLRDCFTVYSAQSIWDGVEIVFQSWLIVYTATVSYSFVPIITSQSINAAKFKE